MVDIFRYEVLIVFFFFGGGGGVGALFHTYPHDPSSLCWFCQVLQETVQNIVRIDAGASF